MNPHTAAFVAVACWASVATLLLFVMGVLLFSRNPLPFPDRGHRCFAVRDEATARLVVSIIARCSGLGERFTFDPGPTHQTLLWDNSTVIIWHDKEIEYRGLSPNAISLVVDDPESVAQKVAADLRLHGYSAKAVTGLMPEVGNKFALVESDAFDGWVLAFRRHILAMGKPPHKRRLT